MGFAIRKYSARALLFAVLSLQAPAFSQPVDRPPPLPPPDLESFAMTDEDTGYNFCVPNITPNLDEVVALLNGQKITLRDVDREMVNRSVYAPFLAEAIRDPLVLSELRPKVLEAMLGMKLLLAEARRSGVVDEQVARARSAELDADMVESPGSRYLQGQKTMIDQALERSRDTDDMRIKFYLNQLYKDVVVSDDDVIKAYNQVHYEARKASKVRASIILIEVPPGADQTVERKALEKAEAVYREAIAPEGSFSELAFKNSDHESAREAGYLGEVAQGEYGIEFERAIRPLKEGEISPPVRTLRGYTIIKLFEKKGPEVRPFSNVGEALRAKLLRDKRYEIMERTVLNLVEKSDLQVRLYGFQFAAQ